MPTAPASVAVVPLTAASPPRDLPSGPPGKVFTYRRRDFLAGGAGEPQAFLVEMVEPGAVIPPHFHREDEFQIVVDGGGSLGKHPLGGVAVHFADAYTPYGPIVVGGDGLAFFTLRARSDPGALYMPGSRASMLRKARRSVAAEVPAEDGLTALWPPHDDGLGAWVARAPAGAPLPDPPGDGGRYYLVVEGAAAHGAAPLPRWSCAWSAAGAARPRLVAGSSGAAIVIAQFPAAS